MPTFTPSPQQSSIFDFITSGSGSCVIEAVAGSGKTTTIVEAQRLIPSYNSVLFLAFNKSIAAELASRVPKHVQVKTFHSHGLTAYTRWLGPRPLIDGNKVRSILKRRLEFKDFELYSQFCIRLIGYAKSVGLGALFPDTPNEWFDLIRHFNLTLDSRDADESTAVRIARETFTESCAQTTVVDFDDMIFMPLLKNVTFDKFQFLFIDEAQDTNAVQRELLSRMFNPLGGRLIAVGDPAQAIYGFRGADSGAIPAIVKQFSCKEFPLSVSYRCSQAVVREAQKLVSHIEFSPATPSGSVKHLDAYHPSDFAPTSVILCRVTAPLVSFAFGFIRRRVGVRILGREIGQGLITLIEKFAVRDFEVLASRLEQYRDREVQKALAKSNTAAAEAVNDRVDCIKIFMDQCEDEKVSTLCDSIAKLFSDEASGLLTLCTVHKSKGLEWPTVYILDKDKYMPSKYAKQDWQVVQEYNLIYVAITRAKLDLRYIESGNWKDKAEVPVTTEQAKRKALLDDI